MSDIIIIGGGIMGMLSARYLTQQGATVTLIEKGLCGKESSWAGGGIISPLYPWRYPHAITQLADFGQQNYPQLCDELKENTGIDPEYQQNGLLIIAENEQDNALQWAKKYHKSIEIIDQNQIKKIEPALQTEAQSALWMPQIGQVRNPRLVKALFADICKRGVKIIENTPIQDFEFNQQQIKAVKSQYQQFEADTFVICNGAWSHDLLTKTQIQVAVEPVMGQMILFKGKPKQITTLTLEKDRYIIPRQDGRVLFGSTLEHIGFNKKTTHQVKKTLSQIAVQRFPVLKTMPIEHHWAGLRPASKTGIPYISPHPNYTNLYFNCGQYRNGVVIGLGSCRLLAEIVTNQKGFVDSQPYFFDNQKSASSVN